MELRIRALDRDEFEAAESNGYVYGTYSRYVDNKLTTFYVFINLGREVAYKDRPTDDPNTSYRKFVGSTVRAANTPEQLDRRKYLFVLSDVDVIIYC